MAIDERRSNAGRRLDKDRRSGVDPRTAEEKGEIGKGGQQLTADRVWIDVD